MADPPQTKFCGKCGTEIALAAKFCSACGIELTTFDSVTPGEASDPTDTKTWTPTPSIETPTPNPTASTRSPRWPFLHRIPPWPFSRRITTLLVLLIVSAALISLAISFWNQSSVTFATNFNIGDRDTAGGRVFIKDVDRLELIKHRHHSGHPIQRHIKSKRDQSAVVHVNRISKHQWWKSHHQHKHFQRSQSGQVVPRR
mgnify:CR=1 FL=1